MTAPLSQYVSVKDKYCICYFGQNKETVIKLFKARELIEKELYGISVYLTFKDEMRNLIKGKKNVILECNMNAYRGKMAYSRNLEENENVKDLLMESNIIFPEDF
jgi:guanylate kinase